MKKSVLFTFILATLVAAGLVLGQACGGLVPKDLISSGSGSSDPKSGGQDFGGTNFIDASAPDSGNGGGYGGMTTQFDSEYGSLASQLLPSGPDFSYSFFRFGPANPSCTPTSPFEDSGAFIASIMTIAKDDSIKHYDSVCDQTGTTVTDQPRIMDYDYSVAIWKNHIYRYFTKPPTIKAQDTNVVAYCSKPGWQPPGSVAPPARLADNVGLDAIVYESPINGHRRIRIVIGKYDGGKYMRFYTPLTYIPTAMLSSSTETFSVTGVEMSLPTQGDFPRRGHVNATVDGQNISIDLDCWRD